MLKLLIINAHWYNHGDEAALRAMIDEMSLHYPDAKINVQLLAGGEYFSYNGNIELLDGQFPAGRRIRWMDFLLRWLSKGQIGIKKESYRFVKAMKKCDLIIHAPGGPSIGDIYKKNEMEYLARFLMAQRLKKPYVFYAPSMGPFFNKKNRTLQKKVVNGAKLITVREPISKKYLEELGIKKPVRVTLDSAFQHPVDQDKYEKLFLSDNALQDFLKCHCKVIGITITDLQWNPKYAGQAALAKRICDTFHEFIDILAQQGYGIIFIPQLFAGTNDADYMKSFMTKDSFLLPDKEEYDCYFQQYLISQLYAVVGMRYHSNIFAAKMETPFVSISYEQKMYGFMCSAGLEKYCLKIEDLSTDLLLGRFNLLCRTYQDYRKLLADNHENWVARSHSTTDMICTYIDENGLNR